MQSRKKGATGQAYGLMVGLVAIVALGAITSSGSSVNTLMKDVANAVDPSTLGQSANGTSDVTPPEPDPTPGISVAGALSEGDPGQWSDGTYALACWDYLIAPTVDDEPAEIGDDGVYVIDPDGSGGDAPFSVYCDMTTDGGGWTLVDIIAVDGESISSRAADSSATNLSTTGGHLLPGYNWSSSGQILCQSDNSTGTQDWRTFNVPASSGMRGYPTSASIGGPFGNASLSYATSNGNTNNGLQIWVYNTSGRIGTLWIGSGGSTSCACGYTGATSGLGTHSSSNNSCTSWVR